MDSLSSFNVANPITLKTTQKIIAPNVLKCLSTNYHCINSMPTGGGKTVLTLWSYLELKKNLNNDLELVIVGPSSLGNKTNACLGESSSPWHRECVKYGVEYQYLSIEELRGSSCSTFDRNVFYQKRGEKFIYPKLGEFKWQNEKEKNKYGKDISSISNDEFSYTNYNGVVVRKNILRTKKSNSTSKYSYDEIFSPTKQWMQYCYEKNVYLVIDESHKGKNETAQNHAVAALIRGLRRATYMKKGRGYFILLTATPMDKCSHSGNYFKMIGTENPVSDNDMFINSSQRRAYEAYLQAKNYDYDDAGIKKHFKDTLAYKIAKELGVINSRGEDIGMVSSKNTAVCFRLWMECVLIKINFSVPNRIIKQVYNGFFNVEDESDMNQIRKAHCLLNEYRETSKGELAKQGLKNYDKARGAIEQGMVPTMVRVAAEKLSENLTCKVVLGFRLLDSIAYAIEILTETYGYDRNEIGRVAGPNKNESLGSNKSKTSNESCKSLIEFQKKGGLRIIVGNLQMISTGIDLQDRHGNEQRFAYTCCDSDITMISQFEGRFCRHGTQSVPQVYICYPKILGPKILGVYERNISKTDIMRSALSSINKEGIEDDIRILYESEMKLPGDYDRYIELPCYKMSYLVDNQVYNISEKKFYPDKSLKDFGYIRTNDEKGRKRYKNTEKVIKFLETQCHMGTDPEDIDGFIFRVPFPSEFNPYPEDAQ
jgi:hypothetical protein